MASIQEIRAKLFRGMAIPAHPLALTAERKLDERRQKALTRYYCAAGAGGIAVGVHTTQFAIRDAKFNLLVPVLQLAKETVQECGASSMLIAGVCGKTIQALAEAECAFNIGYDAVLLSLAALETETIDEMIDHCKLIADVMPIIGFYLQPSVGGRQLPIEFWRRFSEIPNVVAIKIAPFNRYQTLDVVRAVSESGRSKEIALYTGNDDSIVIDLMTTYQFDGVDIQIAGGLLGQWSVGTRAAVNLLNRVLEQKRTNAFDSSMMVTANKLTDINAALFDSANGFAGCIAGIHEVLVRQGFLQGRWCLDTNDDLSPGQKEEIDRVCQIYPELLDMEFVSQHLDQWLT